MVKSLGPKTNEIWHTRLTGDFLIHCTIFCNELTYLTWRSPWVFDLATGCRMWKAFFTMFPHRWRISSMAGADPGSGSQQLQGHALHCSGSPKKLPHLSVARLLPSRNHEKTSHLLVVDELSATENFCLLLQLRSHFIVEGALPVLVVAHGHDDEVPRSQATGDSQLFLANLSRRWSLCSTNRPTFGALPCSPTIMGEPSSIRWGGFCVNL